MTTNDMRKAIDLVESQLIQEQVQIFIAVVETVSLYNEDIPSYIHQVFRKKFQANNIEEIHQIVNQEIESGFDEFEQPDGWEIYRDTTSEGEVEDIGAFLVLIGDDQKNILYKNPDR